MSEVAGLTEGDVIEIREGHRIYAMLPEHFVYANCVGEFGSLAEATVTVGVALNGIDTLFFAGRYIVTKAYYAGGSSTMGDGHRVHCRHVKLPIEISFYENGGFTAVNRDIRPIGRAKQAWSLEGIL